MSWWAQFRERKLQTHYPYIWLDAIVLNVGNNRVVKLSLGIAVGVDAEGERHILGLELGAGESEAFAVGMLRRWLDFLRSLKQRGLEETQLVISDAHSGLKSPITPLDKTLPGKSLVKYGKFPVRFELSGNSSGFLNSYDYI